MPVEKGPLIPQPFKGEVQVKLVLPSEAAALLKDLHDDRQGLAAGGVILLALLASVTVKYLLRRDER